MFSRRLSTIPSDVQEFLDGYRDLDNNTSGVSPDREQEHQNLDFYSNVIKCRPDGLLIEELLERWQGKHNELERRHGFIQWLFPIPEQGINMHTHPLTTSEISEMNSSPTILIRVRRAYELMLDFYGMKLLDTESGLVGRKDFDWENRYQNLARSSHNNLRITRILKCLIILSHAHFAAPFVLHVLSEQSEHGLLNTPMLRSSLDRWWANCNRDEKEREMVQSIIQRVRASGRGDHDKWIFTREMYESMVANRESGGVLALPPNTQVM